MNDQVNQALKNLNIEERAQYEFPKRGQIFMADLGDLGININKGFRPVVIIQNDVGNEFSPNVIIAPISTQIKRKSFPTQQIIKLKEDSVILYEQILTIHKTKLISFIRNMSQEEMSEMDTKIAVSLGMNNYYINEMQSIKVIKISDIINRDGTKSTNYSIKVDLKNKYEIVTISEIEILKTLGDFPKYDYDYIDSFLDSVKGVKLVLSNL